MARAVKAKEGSGSAAAAAILDAATGLFLAAGFDGVSLEQIAQAAGLSRQTVYNLFGSKDALFREVTRRHWATIRAETATAFAVDERRQDMEPANVLRAFARALFRFVEGTEQVAFTRLVVAESRRLPWIAEEFYRAGKQPIVNAFTAALAEMVAAGHLRCDAPEVASRQFLGMIQEFIIWPHVMAIGDDLRSLPSSDVVIEEAIDTFLSRYGSATKGA